MTLSVETRPSIHSAEPSAERARQLRISVSGILRRNLLQTIKTAAKVLPLQSEAARAVAEELDTSRRIAPEIFVVHWQLGTAIRQQDASHAAVALSTLLQAAKDGRLYADSLTVSSLRWDVIDAATVDYLCRAGGPRGPHGELPEMGMLDPALFHTFAIGVREAQLLLLEAQPEMYGEFHELVSDVRLYRPRHVGSMSSPRSFGTMYIYEPNTEDSLADLGLYYLNHITHETSHIALNAVMAQGPLVLNDPQERYPSSVRPDPRPMDGVYHAAFVLSRVALAQSHPAVMKRPVAERTQETTVRAFWAAYETVEQHGKLTDEGWSVINSAKEIVQSAQ